MRYLILGTLALACAAAVSPAVRAMDLSVCDQPIAKLNLQQIEDCKALLTMEKALKNFIGAFDAAKADEREQNEARDRRTANRPARP